MLTKHLITKRELMIKLILPGSEFRLKIGSFGSIGPVRIQTGLKKNSLLDFYIKKINLLEFEFF